jgi:hypothetical protein
VAQVHVDDKECADGIEVVGAVEEVEEYALCEQQQDGERAHESEEVALVDQPRGDEEGVVEHEEHHCQRQQS